MRQFALRFAEHHVPIFPVQVWRDGDRWRKQPHIREWTERATTATTTIEAWWRCWPLAIVGVPLARVGLVVVDADRHGGPDGVAALRTIQLPPHPVVTTKSGGEHHFFRQPAHPAQPVRFIRWEGGEVLGHGRFVVGYAVEPFVARVSVPPADLIDRLPKAQVGNRVSNDTTHIRPSTGTPSDLQRTGSTFLRSKYLIRDLERAHEGNRHCLLHWTSCRFGNMIGEHRMTKHVAEDLLIEAAKANGLWREDPDNCLMTIRDGLRKGKEEWDAWDVSKRAECVV